MRKNAFWIWKHCLDSPLPLVIASVKSATNCHVPAFLSTVNKMPVVRPSVHPPDL